MGGIGHPGKGRGVVGEGKQDPATGRELEGQKVDDGKADINDNSDEF